MILFSHPTGNANVRQAAIALFEAGLLAEFWTCLAPDPDSWWMRHIPDYVATQLLRRSVPRGLQSRTRTVPMRECGRLLSGLMGGRSLSRPEVGIFSVDAVYRSLDRRVGRRFASSRRGALQGIYAYEDGASDSFRICQEFGGKCLYELPIGYWRVWKDLRDEERLREPQWSSTLQGGSDSDDKLARKESELILADKIFVASTFTKETLKMAPFKTAEVHVIPYGAPRVSSNDLNSSGACPLRVLFAGALSQRKGLSYLLAAVKRLGRHVELTLLGAKPALDCAVLNQALRVVRWIPSLPHGEVLMEMQRHDVLAFPSLFEGFGLVILEAMSQGLAVITTPNTVGPDIIEDGRNGFLVPIRSSDGLAECLERLVADRQLLSEIRHAARSTAAAIGWPEYRSRVSSLVSAALSNNSSSLDSA